MPVSSSQAKKITDQVRGRLPRWIESEVLPVLQSAFQRGGLQASLTLAGAEKEKLVLTYQPVKVGNGYIAPTIQLEFGGRATGEPHQRCTVVSDMASLINGIEFPTAQPLVMTAERTFWEKATAAHVYCRQHRLRGERFSRHWYDLAAMSGSGHAHAAISDKQLAYAVARHKSLFYAEKDIGRNPIDYLSPQVLHWKHWKRTMPPCWKTDCYRPGSRAFAKSSALAPSCKAASTEITERAAA